MQRTLGAALAVPLVAVCTQVLFAAPAFRAWGHVPVAPGNAPRKSRMSQARELTAGPVRLRFQDGELRYLYVGDREIVRRVYFAVRNKRWETAMPVFTESKVIEKDGAFTIELKATCKAVGADFSWVGHIEGKPDGTITFQVIGTPGADFDSNRIGLCVLYGSSSMAGQAFETVNSQGETRPYHFPENVQPQLVSPDFQTLRYLVENGPTVAVSVTGAKFDMEDQRTYGDSSFKAYAPLPYAYPAVHKDDVKEQTVTIALTNAPAVQPISKTRPLPTATVTLGAALPEIVLPRIVDAAPDAPQTIFGSVNGQAEKHKDASELSWGYTPFTHLPDDDTAMENLPVLLDQVRTAHSYAPGAVLTLNPVTLNASKFRTDGGSDARAKGAFGGAWSAAFARYAALAGITEAHLSVGSDVPNSPARRVQSDLALHAGQPIRETTISGASSLPSPLDALAVDAPNGPVLWVINKSAREQDVMIEGMPSGPLLLRRVADRPFEGAVSPPPGRGLRLRLAPYEVCRVAPEK